MRPRLPLLLAATLATLPALAVAPGDSRDRVEAELGAPSINRRLPDGTELARYETGEVVYRDGVVRETRLVTPAARAEQRAAEARLAAERADRLARAREETAARIAADNRALDALLDSAEFRLLSPGGRRRALRELKRAHPAATTERLDADLVATLARSAEADRRIARLEAELAATRAELAAARHALSQPRAAGAALNISESAPAYGVATTTFHPNRPGKPQAPGYDPINNTPQVGAPGAVIPNNPIGNIIVTPKANTNPVTRSNPISNIIVTPRPNTNPVVPVNRNAAIIIAPKPVAADSEKKPGEPR